LLLRRKREDKKIKAVKKLVAVDEHLAIGCQPLFNFVQKVEGEYGDADAFWWFVPSLFARSLQIYVLKINLLA
jgi:hypothetical protein